MLRKIPNVRRAYMAAGGIALFTIGAAVAETPVDRGAYLVTTIGSCGNCHSPRDAPGHVAAGKELSGGFEFDEDVGHVIGSNITPDRETGIGTWTEAEIITALRDGKRPDGTIIGPPMPIIAYRKLSDKDAVAIAAYCGAFHRSTTLLRGPNTKSRCRRPTDHPSPTSPNLRTTIRQATAVTSRPSGIACCAILRRAGGSPST